MATVDDDEALEDEAALRAMASGLQTKREATEVAISWRRDEAGPPATEMRCGGVRDWRCARSVRNVEIENNDLVTKVRKISGDTCSVRRFWVFHRRQKRQMDGTKIG